MTTMRKNEKYYKTEKSVKTRVLFEKINKTDKILARLIKGKNNHELPLSGI